MVHAGAALQLSAGWKTEDYHVPSRIDKETSVEQWHRDACTYWGYSVRDLIFYKKKVAQNPGNTYAGLDSKARRGRA